MKQEPLQSDGDNADLKNKTSSSNGDKFGLIYKSEDGKAFDYKEKRREQIEETKLASRRKMIGSSLNDKRQKILNDSQENIVDTNKDINIQEKVESLDAEHTDLKIDQSGANEGQTNSIVSGNQNEDSKLQEVIPKEIYPIDDDRLIPQYFWQVLKEAQEAANIMLEPEKYLHFRKEPTQQIVFNEEFLNNEEQKIRTLFFGTDYGFSQEHLNKYDKIVTDLFNHYRNVLKELEKKNKGKNNQENQ